MRFGSLCSGIEGAAVALNPLDWSHVFCAEVDPFCCAVLDARHPLTTNLHDVTSIERIPCVDALVAGTPCQSYSVGGNRKGMGDVRGQLALALPRLAGWARPRWVVWENVPGVLSCNSGRDFGRFLHSMAELGYGFAYRVLDARYFGVAQRRRRVFAVFHLGDWRPAAAALFERPISGEDARPPRQARRPSGVGTADAPQLLGWSGDTTPKFGSEVTPTLRASQGGEGVGVISDSVFRKLSVVEWERLQGFPDGYTDLPGWPDRLKRRALGNAFCVPVVHWIGERIDGIEKELRSGVGTSPNGD
jgi:DNA (cytosine-5)-methyltransferase 1